MSAMEGFRRGVLPGGLMERWGTTVPLLDYCYGKAAEGLARDLGMDSWRLGRRTDGRHPDDVRWPVPPIRTVLETLVYDVAGLVLGGRQESYPLDEMVSLAVEGMSPGQHLDMLLALGGEDRVKAFEGTAEDFGGTVCSVTRFVFARRLGQAFEAYERGGVFPGTEQRAKVRQRQAAERRRDRMKDRRR